MKRLLLLLALSGAAADAHAFAIELVNGNPLAWPTSTADYQLDQDATSDITDGSDLAAVQRAVSSWNGVACSTITLVQSGTTTSTDTMLTTGYTDGVNRLAWVEDSRWQYGEWVLGVTSPVFNGAGEIEEADIAFNGYLAQWSTDGSASDIESVVVHELGHFIGIQHVLNGEYSADPPTMAPSVDPYGRTASLSADDRAAACYLYPATPYSCAAPCDCPAVVDQNQGGEFNAGRLECANHVCGRLIASAGGNLPLGSTCSGNDCAGGLFCQPVGGAGSYCSQLCNPAANDCPSGFDCYGYQGSSDGACLPRNMQQPEGETCLVGGTGSPTTDNPTTATPRPRTSSTCSCDETYDCDPDCSCDEDPCKGCAATSGPAAHQGLLLAAIACIFFARRLVTLRRSL